MGLFDRFKPQNEDITVASPLDGRAIPLNEVPDDCFSAGIVGPGCAIWPEDDIIYAPFDGKVIHLPDTLHALGLRSTMGVEVIIHVGLDTVEMEGKGFTAEVKEGQSIKQGDKLLRFDRDAIVHADHPDITMVIVTNSDVFQSVEFLKSGMVTCGQPVLKVIK